MISRIIEQLLGFTTAVIGAMGYGGIVLLMAIESACIPLPSEIIMPFAGYLVFRGETCLDPEPPSADCTCPYEEVYYRSAAPGRAEGTGSHA